MIVIIHLCIILLFVALSIMFSFGKGAGLIAGYNDKYDEKKLCKFMSKFMYALAFCGFIILSSEVFYIMILYYIGLALFAIVVICALVYMNTGSRFEK